MIQEILLIYLVLIISYFIFKSLIFRKKNKVNPFAFLQTKGKELVCWSLFFLILLTYILLIILFNLELFGPKYESLTLSVIGFIILFSGFIVMVVAHAQMSKSWRMGNDFKKKTKLISAGLFKHSRNPVYAGIMIQTLGLLFIIPNITTLVLFIALIVVFNLIVSQEEKFLEKQFGKEYIDYKKKVRRFI